MPNSVFGVDQALERFRTARFRTKYGTDYVLKKKWCCQSVKVNQSGKRDYILMPADIKLTV